VKAEILQIEDMLRKDLPSFFSPARNEILIELFEVLDVDERQELSYHDIKLVIHYLFSKRFGVELTSKQVLKVFEQADRCKNNGIRMNDFVILIASIKRLSDKFRTEPRVAKLISKGMANQLENNRGSWQAALDRIDVCALDGAWELILGKLENTSKVYSLHLLHKDRGAACWSCENLDAALGSCGVNLNENQLCLLYSSLDVDGDGEITSEEFIDAFHTKRLKFETPGPLKSDVNSVPESSSDIRPASSVKEIKVHDIDQKLSQRHLELSELDELYDEIVAAIANCKLEIDSLEYRKNIRCQSMSPKAEVLVDSPESGVLLKKHSTWI
jgi:Ca2+-binding EF-hand superfamily protein